MSLLRSYRVLRFALLLLAILSQCVALESFSLLVIVGTLTAISWYVTEGPRGRSIPGWISRLLVLVVVMFSLLDAFGPVEELPKVLGSFVVWLTVIKMYSKRTIENEAQLLLLSLLLMAVGGLYASDLLFGILLVLWFGLAAWVMLLYQLSHGCEMMRMERYRAVPIEQGTPWTRPVTGRDVHIAFRKTAIILLLFVGISSVVFFVAMPREQGPSALEMAVAHDDGSDRMVLKPDRDIEPSNKQVMSVTLSSRSGKFIQLSQGLRLRGNVLNAYRGGGVWETSGHLQSSISTSSQNMTDIGINSINNATLLMHVDFHQPMKRVYSLYQPVSIQSFPATRIVENKANSTIGMGTGSPPIRSYDIGVNLQSIITSPMIKQEDVYDNPEIRELTIRILEEHLINPAGVAVGSEEERYRAANAIAGYLRSNEFTYAIDGSEFSMPQRIEMEHDEDPIASFILDRKRGHCEFFAAAMVGMCDTVGIPARIVTGYYVDRWDDVSKRYIVLDRDAHAWVEVEVVPLGWATFDPTPSSEGAPTWQEPMSFAESIRFAWQRWEMAWQANVIGFDSAAQQKVIDVFKPMWNAYVVKYWDYVKEKTVGFMGWFQVGVGGKLWLNLVLGAMILSSFAFLIFCLNRWKTRKTLGLIKQVERDVPTVSVEFYAKFQHVLQQQGFIRPHHIPAMHWISELPLVSESTDEAISLTSTYYEIRFGGLRPTSQQRKKLLQRSTSFKLVKGASHE